MMNKSSLVCVMLLLSACAESGEPENVEEVVAMGLRRDPPDDPGPIDPSDCDDGNECTVEWVSNGRCRTRRLADWSDCSDGDACNGPEYCRAGSCLNNGQPVQCDDGNACTDESCDPGSGSCVVTNNTASCSDGSSCTVADACDGGVCVGLGSTSGQASVPTISSVEASAPAPSAVLTSGSIYYLAGDTFDLELTVASCSYVTGVQIGGAMLTTAPRLACGEFEDVRDCEPRYYTVEDDTLFADGSRRLRLRLHLRPAPGDGLGTDASVVVSSALGVATHDFTIARVAEVRPSIIGVTASTSDLHNAFVTGVYQSFGDAGQYRDPASNALKAYAPDYDRTFLVLETDRMRIGMKYKVPIDNWCDPTVTVDSRYQLINDGSSISAVRVDAESSVSFDFGLQCDVAPWFGFVQWFAAGLAQDAVRDSLDGPAQAIADGLCGDSCGSLVVTVAPGEVRLQTLNPYQSVAIDVSYEARRSRFPADYGLPVAAGDTLVITAQNLGAGCDTVALPGQTCFGTGMGPRGVPNWSAAPGTDGAMPIPHPAARLVLDTLNRSPAGLPRPDQPVGITLAGLLSRGNLPPLAVGTGPCQIVTTTDDVIGIGPNDLTTTNGGVMGTGLRRINVLFNPPIAGLPACN